MVGKLDFRIAKRFRLRFFIGICINYITSVLILQYAYKKMQINIVAILCTFCVADKYKI